MYKAIVTKRFRNKYNDSTEPEKGVCISAIFESILPITDMAISVPIPIPIYISVHL